MKKSRLYFDKKYKCVHVFFIVHYKALTLSVIAMTFIRRMFTLSGQQKYYHFQTLIKRLIINII